MTSRRKAKKDKRPTQQKCAVCGLIYPLTGPYPACGSEDGPKGPRGLNAEMRRYMKCVLGFDRIGN